MRAELVSWTLHDADPELAARAGEHFDRLGHWFEEHLVLRGGGEGLVEVIRRIGVYAITIE